MILWEIFYDPWKGLIKFGFNFFVICLDGDAWYFTNFEERTKGEGKGEGDETCDGFYENLLCWEKKTVEGKDKGAWYWKKSKKSLVFYNKKPKLCFLHNLHRIFWLLAKMKYVEPQNNKQANNAWSSS